MNALAKTPVTVITGFLGAGKTTLIRHLIANAGGRKLAVLVNEFGTAGVDGDILKSCSNADCPETNILELANGCICCTVADDFIPAMEQLLALSDPPDHILIETSGLALPKPLLRAFDWPAVRSRITVDGVIALADAEALAAGDFDEGEAAGEGADHDSPLAEVFEDQVNCADIILLTKSDLADADTRAAARAKLAGIAHRELPVIEVSEGIVDPRVILGLEAAAEGDLAARPSHHDGADDHEHEDFDSVVIELPEVTDPADLTARIERLAREQHILRVKGHVAVQGKPMRLLVQAVGARVRQQYDQPWTGARVSQLVVIGEHHDIDEAAIRQVLLG
ncbi:cobalamin biosynthesis protein CobW [Paracoccus sp. DMF-8]|uniref:cobalamin biosynthesis protein CobW n=1 Tax=Paracoccus sp. DMF-8 TaxID=3019445 RepID=UPI0023E40519|nr:cobalamin biosynthesis protein CobW [Paracoccus sp. DMF-8]MDF3607455.1 cobalamin biosynthesis protein CobW [Paracoccus sp. DMF-8]